MTRIDVVEAAKLIRKDLKEFFPRTKFSVRSSRYTYGASISIRWTDGPATKAVEDLVHKYRSKGAMQMDDYVPDVDHTLRKPITLSDGTKLRSGEVVHFGSDYVFCKRSYSREFLEMVAQEEAERWGLSVPEVRTHADGEAYLVDNYEDIPNGHQTLWHKVMQRAQEIDAGVHGPAPSKKKKKKPKVEREDDGPPQFQAGEYVFASKDVPLIDEPDIPAGIAGIVTEGNHMVSTVEVVSVKFCDPWNTRVMHPDGLTHGPSGLIARKTAEGWTFSGRTYHYRRTLRKAGCTWDKDAEVWRLPGDALPDAIEGLLVGRFVAEHTGEGWRFTGGTYPHQNTFREAGCTWDRKAQAWTCEGEMPATIRAILEGEAPADPPPEPEPAPSKPAEDEDEEATKAAKRAAKFRELADRMEDDIQDKLDPAIGRLNPTRRRAGIAAGMRAEGRELQVIQAALRGLADAWEAGSVERTLVGIDAKKQVARLVGYERMPSPTHEAGDYKSLLRVGIHAGNYTQARAALYRLVEPSAGEETPEDRVRAAMDALIGRKLAGYFPTPPDVVERMLRLADIRPGHFVLEPSAGTGHIADAVREQHPKASLAVAEIQPALVKVLELKEHEHVAWDFLEDLDPDAWAYMDRIVMNPPFEKGQDIEHVRHAFDLLAPGGRLVSVMCEGPFFRSDRKSQAFRDWLDSQDGWSEPLPEGAFKQSDRPTGVKTRLVVIDKDAA